MTGRGFHCFSVDRPCLKDDLCMVSPRKTPWVYVVYYVTEFCTYSMFIRTFTYVYTFFYEKFRALSKKSTSIRLTCHLVSDKLTFSEWQINIKYIIKKQLKRFVLEMRTVWRLDWYSKLYRVVSRFCKVFVARI